MIKYFSMFSGIGGFELGIQYASDKRSDASSQQTKPNEDMLQMQLGQTVPTLSRDNSRIGAAGEEQRSFLPTNIGGIGAICVGYSEIDKYAIKVYERQFKHENYGDATKINATELQAFDLLVGGFPCQSFSIAGKRNGFNDTRGTLFFDIARILAEKRPRHLVLENVKGLLSHDSGKTFQTILGVLSDLGYRVEWQVLNSKNFGVPQNRERIYFIGHLRGECSGEVLPITGNNGQAIENLGYLNSPTWQKRNESIRRVYGTDGVAPTIPTGTGGGVMPKLAVDMTLRASGGHRIRKDGRAGTLDANYYKGIANQERPGVKEGLRIRRLTPLECERLQGFLDNWTEGESDTQRYKMCGNAVTVNTVQAVMERLFEHEHRV